MLKEYVEDNTMNYKDTLLFPLCVGCPWFLLAAFELSGCQLPPSDHYSVSIDPGFTITEQEEIATALQAWHAATYVMFDMHIGSCEGGSYSICIRPSNDLGNKSSGEVYGIDTSAGSWDQHGNIYMLSGVEPIVFNFGMRHELGHTLGLQHTQLGTVMYYNGGWSADGDPMCEITCADTQQYWAVRGKEVKCSIPYQLTGQ